MIGLDPDSMFAAGDYGAAASRAIASAPPATLLVLAQVAGCAHVDRGRGEFAAVASESIHQGLPARIEQTRVEGRACFNRWKSATSQDDDVVERAVRQALAQRPEAVALVFVEIVDSGECVAVRGSPLIPR